MIGSSVAEPYAVQMRPLVEQQFEEYLAYCSVERNLSRHTVAAYRRDLREYVSYLLAQDCHSLALVPEMLVVQYVQELSGRQAATSVARAAASIRGFHRFGLRERWVTVDVAHDVATPAPGKRLPKALDVDDVERLIESGDPGSPLGLRAMALADLLYSTGCRVSEALALDLDDVTGDVGVLRVRGKGNKERLVPLGRKARATIDAYVSRGRPALLLNGKGTPALFVNERGGRLSRQSAGADIDELARRAAVTAHVSPHVLRHSFARHLLRGGADVRVVQELLGHASVATTQIYTRVTVDQLRDVYAQAHPRAR